MMAILILNFIRDNFNFIQLVTLVLRIKMLGCINVVKTTEIISVMKQTKKKTFSDNIKILNNISASIVYQA